VFGLPIVIRAIIQVDVSPPRMVRPLETLVDHPLPWTKMRRCYRLLGLVKGPLRSCGSWFSRGGRRSGSSPNWDDAGRRARCHAHPRRL